MTQYHSLRRWIVAIWVSLTVTLAGGGVRSAHATWLDGKGQPELPPQGTPRQLQHVGVNEHLDGQIPLDAAFRDESGKSVRIGDYFGKHPAIVILAYYRCPVLCSMVQNATASALQGVSWTVGKDFDVVVVSIDPTDTPELATEKREKTVTAYGRPGSASGFHFLVGDKTQIDRVAQAVGFQYEYDENQKQYAHPAVITVAKPNGELARYFYGIQYEPQDLRLALLEASRGKSISTVDRVVLYCYHFDPQQGKYVLLATRLLQLGGVITLVVFGSIMGLFWMKERQRMRAAKDEESSTADAVRHGEPRDAEATGIGT